MKGVLVYVILLGLFMSACQQENSYKPQATPYIPKDIEECIAQIDMEVGNKLRKEAKHLSEDDFINFTYATYGMWIRNNWGLWKGSRLKQYFSVRGVSFAENISVVIFTSYYRYVTGRKINFGEILKANRG